MVFLADFEGRFEHFTGMSPDQYRAEMTQKYGEKKATEMFWKLIDTEIGIRFWRGIPWMPGGKELWDYIKPYKPTLLTAPSYHDSSRIGKNYGLRIIFLAPQLFLNKLNKKLI
jgi:hypothetical protein